MFSGGVKCYIAERKTIDTDSPRYGLVSLIIQYFPCFQPVKSGYGVYQNSIRRKRGINLKGAKNDKIQQQQPRTQRTTQT